MLSETEDIRKLCKSLYDFFIGMDIMMEILKSYR